MEPKENRELSPDDLFMNIPRVYSNAVKVSRSFYDFQLIFGNVAVNNLGDKPKQLIEPKFIAQLSPQHFKILTQILNKQLQQYEKEYGPISDPPEAKKAHK